MAFHQEGGGRRKAKVVCRVPTRSVGSALTINIVSPRAKHELAREHYNRGLRGVDSGDTAEAVAWLFLSLEAAVVSLAVKHELDTKQPHRRKAEVAKELHDRGVMPDDVSKTLRVLNEARKVATYDGDEPDLEGRSLEDIAADVDAVVGLAEREAAA